MRRFLLALTLACATVAGAAAAGSVPAALAATDVQVQMNFTEQGVSPGCAVTDGMCGRGRVVPYGPATETIEFGAGCGGTCDLRTVFLPGGSLLIDEHSGDGTCPGPPADYPCRPSSGQVFKPFMAPLSDTVAGGTGIFEGATGALSGTVFGAGPVSGSVSGTITGGVATISLSGTITLAS